MVMYVFFACWTAHWLRSAQNDRYDMRCPVRYNTILITTTKFQSHNSAPTLILYIGQSKATLYIFNRIKLPGVQAARYRRLWSVSNGISLCLCMKYSIGYAYSGVYSVDCRKIYANTVLYGTIPAPGVNHPPRALFSMAGSPCWA